MVGLLIVFQLFPISLYQVIPSFSHRPLLEVPAPLQIPLLQYSLHSFLYRGTGRNSRYQSSEEYSYYLRFNVSIRFNHLNPQYNANRYTPQHRELYELIQSLRDEGLSYRRISKLLNDRGILTPNNKKMGFIW